MLHDLGWLKQVKLEDSTGAVINPATIEKLDELKAALTAIYGAVDGLELITGNISIDAAQINLNTDDLETKIQSVRDQLDVLLSTRASETTLANVKTVLDTLGGAIDVNLSTLATESTLAAVKDAVDTLETKLQTVIDSLDVNLSTRVSELNFNNKVGEVQTTPTANTILGRLKDLYDKLVAGISVTLEKIKIWDGTNTAAVTSDNKLETITHGRGKCSTLNSTNIPLGAGITFVGDWEEILDYSHINILVLADQDSAVDGLVIEWSCDGSTIEQTDEFTIYANKGKTYSFGAIASYYRIKYTNNATYAQSLFKLQLLLKRFSQKPSSHRIKDIIIGEDDAELVKAVLTGQKDGEYVNVKVDEFGRLQTVVTPTAANKTLQILWDRYHQAVNNGEWQELLTYTVPEGYDLNCISFDAVSPSVGNESARVMNKESFGSFVGSTNTFTDGTFNVLPYFSTRMYVYVTTQIGSAVNDTFTITYTNATGVTGRTATVTITKSSLVGTRLEVTLQAGDRGVLDVTNVTHSATGQAGAINVEGIQELFYLTLTSTNTQYAANAVGLGGIVVPSGDSITLQYLSSSATNYVRRLNLVATLVPII